MVIEPANGAEAVIEECDGGILKVRVTKCGSGFRELPEVYINTQTGLNAFLIPVLKFHKENFDEFPEGTTCNCRLLIVWIVHHLMLEEGDIMTQTNSVPVKGETKTYKKNQFNTSEGGTYYGHTNANNAKMVVMFVVFSLLLFNVLNTYSQQGGH